MWPIDTARGTRNAVTVPLTHAEIYLLILRELRRQIAEPVRIAIYLQSSSLPARGNDTEGLTGSFLQTEQSLKKLENRYRYPYEST